MAVRLLLSFLFLSAGYVPISQGGDEGAEKPGQQGAVGPWGGSDKDPKKDVKWVKRVHESIDRGVQWLLSVQEHSGRFKPFEDARHPIFSI